MSKSLLLRLTNAFLCANFEDYIKIKQNMTWEAKIEYQKAWSIERFFSDEERIEMLKKVLEKGFDSYIIIGLDGKEYLIGKKN